MIQFLCPHCTFKITAGDTVAGKPAQCPLCEKDIVIPNAPARSESAPPPAVVEDDVPLAEPVNALPTDDYPARAKAPETDDRYTDRPRLPRPDAEDDFEDRPRRRRRDDEDDYDIRVRRPRRLGAYADCPNCRAPGDATPVGFTWWGGFIGPLIISCVRCRQCGTQYNGTHGDSNGMRILIYNLVCFGIVIGICVLGNIFSAGVFQGLGGIGPPTVIPASSPLKGKNR
jgi:hypothetical protein